VYWERRLELNGAVKMIKLICQRCGKEYYVKPYRKSTSKYCSRLCGIIKKKCEACGKEFSISQHRKNARFCSRKCWTTSDEAKQITSKSSKLQRQINPYIGSKNPNWKGGLTTEQFSRLTSKIWEKIRKNIIKRDGGHCVVCGSTKGLSVHHKTRWRYSKSDNLNNLELLCSSCHPIIEANPEMFNAIQKYCSECKDKYCEKCSLKKFQKRCS
jgi:hypothetical protein